MKNWRNLLFLLGFLGFCAWYGGSWAYKTQFVEPRAKLSDEIKKLEQQKTNFETNITNQQTALQQLTTRNLYRRSLPTGNARTLYHSWLLEASEACGFDDITVNDRQWRNTGFYSSTGSYYLSARTTLDNLSRFLYEFYWAPYVHRITFLNIQPIDNADLVDIEIQIEGLVIPSLTDPNARYPLRDQLPDGYWPRLSSGRLETYTEPIDSRNLLQFARSGIDASDYVRLTGIVIVGGMPQFWFTNHLNEQTLRFELNEQFRVGSFIGKIIEVLDRGDVILETDGTYSRPGMRWMLSQGETLADATAVPEEF